MRKLIADFAIVPMLAMCSLVLPALPTLAQDLVSDDGLYYGHGMEQVRALAQDLENRIVADLGAENVHVWVLEPSSWSTGSTLDVLGQEPPQSEYVQTFFAGPFAREIIRRSGPAIYVAVSISVEEVLRSVGNWLSDLLSSDDELEVSPGTEINIQANDGVIYIVSGGNILTPGGNQEADDDE